MKLVGPLAECSDLVDDLPHRGRVLSDRAAGLALVPEARATAGEQVVDVLVALHALDPAEVGLEGLVRRTGYVERQLRRWHAQVHAAETADQPSARALDLLRAARRYE